MVVSQATKDAYFSSTSTKHLDVYIGRTKDSFTIPEERIIADSMTLKEELMPSNKIEFGGMYGISFEIEVFYEDRPSIDKEDRLVATLRINEKDDEGDVIEYDSIPLFTGLVVEVKKLNSLGHYKILAYDPIGYNSDLSVNFANSTQGVDGWKVESGSSLYKDVYLGDFFNYNKASHDSSLGLNFRSLFARKIKGISGDNIFSFSVTEENESTVGKNENKTITYPDISGGLPIIAECNRIVNYPQPTKFIDLYKDFFEFIGAYGIGCRQADANGFLHIDKRCGGSNYTLEESNVPYYKSLWIEDVNRPSKNGIAFIPSDTNYEEDESLTQSSIIIKDNWVAQNGGWWKSYQGRYIPFMQRLVNQPNYTLVTKGMPWVEVGKAILNVNEIKIGDRTESRKLIVMNRTLKGIQNMTDTFTLNFSISESGDYATSTQQRLSNIESYVQNGFFNRDKNAYVTELPETFETNTVYFVRKEE